MASAWEPDPLLAGVPVGQNPADERAGLGRGAPEIFEQLDIPVSGADVSDGHAGLEASSGYSGREAFPPDTGREGSVRREPAGGPVFEPLAMEYLTGVPKSETVPSAVGDGLEFEPEPMPEPDLSADHGPEVELDDARDAELKTESADDANDNVVDATIRIAEANEGVDPVDGGASALETEGAADLDEQSEETDAFVGPPIPMIRESEHLEQLEAVRRATREAVWAEAHRKGLEEGSARTRRALEAEFAREREALRNLLESVRTAALDPIALHAPLRRLAVHLAMELVRGELSLSSDAIGRLIGTCLAEIDRAPGDHLVLSLHPDDLERWIAQPAISLDRVELRSDPAIGPGSVRLAAGDTVIEDLLEHRLSSIATRVLGEGGAQRLPRLGALRARGFAEGDISDVG